ncbi:MAG: cupin domain-containing protein [Candidatus Aquirickettsiella sp.]
MLSKNEFFKKLDKMFLNENLKSEIEFLKINIKGEDPSENISADILIKKLNLKKLNTVTDEDGYFKEFVNTIDSNEQDNQTEIFYLLKGKQVSCLHILDTTETWHWLAGKEISIFIFKKQQLEKITLNETNPCHTIEKGTLFGAKISNLVDDNDFSLVTCLCKPGFTSKLYSNSTLEELKILKEKYPDYKSIIDELAPKKLKNPNTTESTSSEAPLSENPKNNCFFFFFSSLANYLGIKKSKKSNSLIIRPTNTR